MRPSTASWVLSLVMHTCSGTSAGTSLSECRYATRSKKGMMTLNPGSSTSWNLPNRSTTQALCCGTTRTPSITNTTTSAMMAKGIQNAWIGGDPEKEIVAAWGGGLLK